MFYRFLPIHCHLYFFTEIYCLLSLSVLTNISFLWVTYVIRYLPYVKGEVEKWYLPFLKLQFFVFRPKYTYPRTYCTSSIHYFLCIAG